MPKRSAVEIAVELPPPLIETLIDRLLSLRIAGRDLSHTREANLKAIDRLLEGDPFYTLGIHRVENLVRSGRLDRLAVLEAVAGFTGCNRDPEVTHGPNYINPRACLRGLWQAAQRLRRVRDRRGSVVFGSGHPGTMLGAYSLLAQFLQAGGCRVPLVAPGAEVAPDWFLDFVGPVACVSDTCSVQHTHTPLAMDAYLDRLPSPPDLAFVDHGFAGACLNRHIPCLVPMDTNDPALAVAAAEGENFVLIPMNDNLPNATMQELAEILQVLITLAPSSAEI
ncbi:MAG: phosphatase [Candidatus Sericytochromatia bacterium]|nr:phosphatase [Candidatus Sericytochromatia bacterium]